MSFKGENHGRDLRVSEASGYEQFYGDTGVDGSGIAPECRRSAPGAIRYGIWKLFAAFLPNVLASLKMTVPGGVPLSCNLKTECSICQEWAIPAYGIGMY